MESLTPLRHKRPFSDISHGGRYSPSPMPPQNPPSPSLPVAPQQTAAPSQEHYRRRTPHFYNRLSIPPIPADPYSMPVQVTQRPALEHRADQTIIDLTSDVEESAFSSQNFQPRRQSQQELIDLTTIPDDAEPEVQITGSIHIIPPPQQLHRVSSPPRPRVERRWPEVRHDSPGLFVGNDARGIIDNVVGAFGLHFPANLRDHIMNNNQPMPLVLNYNNPAAANPNSYVQPSPAKDNFTRSAKDDDIVICPGCSEELIHRKDARKDAEGPALGKLGRAPCKKDTAEHPWWVIKDCGHVYCDSCYQKRTSRTESSFAFSGCNTTKKVMQCTVEDCKSDVKGKDKWVGVFP